ncbi:hypothetical protein Tco_1411476 [Tanacetum coccineum]
MAGPVEGGGPGGTEDREVTHPPLTKEQIEGHVSTLKSLVKDHNHGNKTDPIRMNFEVEDTEVHDQVIEKGKKVVDKDLRKPFKEARRTPLTRRIIEFAGPEYKMPATIKLYDGTTDLEDHLSHGSAKGWFERPPRDNINEWFDLREAFTARYSIRRACFKEPHEITKIVRKANESLTAFKKRSWMILLDPKKYAYTELSKGEAGDSHRKASLSFSRRDNRSYRNTHPVDSRRSDYRNNYRGRDTYLASRVRDYMAPYPPPRGEYNNRVAPVLTLASLTKHTKEIPAI